MNKKELVAAVAEQAGLKKVDAEKAIEAFTAVVEGALKAGDKVQLVGFGTFEVAERPEREGHTVYALRKCHCISIIHLEILRSEDSESTLLLGTVPLVSSIITFSYVKKTTLNLIIVALKIRLFE